MSKFPQPALTTLVAVLSWSVVMAGIGQTAAVTTLIPSLVLIVQQVTQPGARTRTGSAAGARADGRDEERSE